MAAGSDGVESAMKALVAGLGPLSAHQQVTAAAALALAGKLDGERDSAKASALSRELRSVMAALAPVAAGAGRRSAPASGDSVARIQDEVARKRREREASG